tara:strand:- start:645 stop:1820 length:1176 start_codon:yes stop_codon:yes gene_type:complete
MNQTLKSSMLLIGLLGISFFAFRFLNNSFNQENESSNTEAISTSTTIIEKAKTTKEKISPEITSKVFENIEISFDEFVNIELKNIKDDCTKFGSWFSLTEKCLAEWLLVLNNIDMNSSEYADHYEYTRNYFMSNYQNLNSDDLDYILESLTIEAKLITWNEKLLEVREVFNIKNNQKNNTTAIFLTGNAINKSKNIGTSELTGGCIDEAIENNLQEIEWVEPETVNTRDEEKFNYAIKIEPSLSVDPICIKNLLFLILNNDLGWTNVVEKSFQLTSVEDSDYVYIFASPEKTDDLCAPIETNSIYSCRNENNIVLNFYRWQEGAVDFNNDMETYRIYLINHETGHILGWGHVGCPKEGAIAPVMMQQSKGTDGCVPYGWPIYETVKSKFNR